MLRVSEAIGTIGARLSAQVMKSSVALRPHVDAAGELNVQPEAAKQRTQSHASVIASAACRRVRAVERD
jgi:hypothetical protein